MKRGRENWPEYDDRNWMDVAVAPGFGKFVSELRVAAPRLCAHLDEMVDRWLAGLLARLNAGYIPKTPKIFNDPVWGCIILEPAEVLLLDTPLLQRLRGVCQLGMAHYVFPGAGYDRLEHIRGVVEGAQRILTALDNSISRRRSPSRKPSDREAIRLAALLHDIGHGPFSHATEDLIAARHDVEIGKATAVLTMRTS